MSGEIKETYLSDLHDRTKEDGQSSLVEFGGPENEGLGTTIAVVTDPTGGIEEVSDEFMPELGMPEKWLNQLRKKRSELDGDNTHNRAVKEIDLPTKYREYLDRDGDAKQSIEEIVRRINEGETITLICFEKEPKWCHRHLLREVIDQKVSD